ncbi:hypothetical protein [Streptomyces sp. NPDC059092]|uniref:hypothetical protein n=1 Tax=Streptomyces sp. NPDC059092 TaxID=3346725 RepID=UPI00368C2472
MTETGSPLRALRAAAFAAVCVTLTAVGHALASAGSGSGSGPGSGTRGASGAAEGHELSLTVLLAAFAVTAGAAWLAGGRRRGALSIGTGLLTVQVLLHLVFAGALPYGPTASRHAPHTGTGTGAGSGSGVDMSGGMGFGMGAGAGIGMETAAEPEAGPALGLRLALEELFGGSPAMLAAHLLAAVVCALWLAQGEAALFRLAHAVGALAFTPLRLLLTAVTPPAAPRLIRPRPGTSSRARRLRGVVLAHTVSRRGPPARRAPRATAPGAAATAV